MRKRTICAAVLTTILVIPSIAMTKTQKPWTVDVTVQQTSTPGQQLLRVHLVYGYDQTSRWIRANESIATIGELYSADLMMTAHAHEIRDLPDTANSTVVAAFPVKMNEVGYFSGSVKLSYIADDTEVVEAGEYTFRWKNDGDGPELISSHEYFAWLMRPPSPPQPSNEHLEPGDVPGERVIHVPNAGPIAECGVDAACPRRTQ